MCMREREREREREEMIAEFLSENSKSRDHVKERPRYILEVFIEMNCK